MTAPAHLTETADDPFVTPDPVIETKDERRTRLSVYHEIKRLLVAQGIPEHEIAFVHDYEGPAAQAELSRKLNAGEIRIVLASTIKLGVGANIQQRLYAIHHGDPPWVPASIEQRDGRMLRQGNIYPEVHVCQYVTEGSFDAYSWQLLENKSRFISQVMRGDTPARVAEDVDLAVLTASQIKAIASGNPLVLEKVGLETELTRLDRLHAIWRAGRNRLRYDLALLPEKIGKAEADLRAHAAAIEARNRNLPGGAQSRGLAIKLRRSAASDVTIAFTERELAGNQIRQLIPAVEREALKYGSATLLLGEYAGFEIYASATCLNVTKDLSQSLFGQSSLHLRLKDHRAEYGFNLTDSDAGIIQSMDARLRSIDKRLVEADETHRQLTDRRVRIEEELAKGWEYATKFQELRARLDALNASMRIEGLITEDPLHLAELSEEAFLPTAPKLNGIPPVVCGAEQAAGSIESVADHKSLEPQIGSAIPATSECAVPVPASPVKTAGHQGLDLQIEAAIPTAPENGVEEKPASEARDASATADWDELFAQRERIKAEREKRPRSKRRASSRSSAQLSFDWT
jgi:hypothetical protein